MSRVIDITAKGSNPPGGDLNKHYRVRSGKVVDRDPKSITGIVLHQTGTPYSVSSGQVSKAGGDPHEALHNRGLGIHTNMVAFDGSTAGVRCGHAVFTHPLKWYIYHGNGLSGRSLSIEVEGKYPLKQEPGVDLASPQLIEAARDGLKFLVEEGRRQGMPIKYIWAHRQSDGKNRAADPGEELWRKLVVDYAVPVLGLEMQPDLTTGDGKPIPEQWGRVGGSRIPSTSTLVGVAGGIGIAFLGGLALLRHLKKRRSSKTGGMSGVVVGSGSAEGGILSPGSMDDLAGMFGSNI